jgi:negative regulator of sigma E activity
VTHVTHEQLSALLDAALPGSERVSVEAHLASCDTCRADYEAMRAGDALFAETLANDPGDAYFESFAARVGERIAAEAPPEAAPLADTLPPARGRRVTAPWYDIGSWFQNPGRLAWAGGVAAVVVTAGVVLMIARESGVPELRDAALLDRGKQRAPRSAPEAGLMGANPNAPAEESPAAGIDATSLRDDRAQAKEKGAAEKLADRDAIEENSAESRLAAPARVREMKQVPGGEDVAVGRSDVPGFARTPAAAPPPAPAGEPVRVTRQRRAEPLRSNEADPQKTSKDEAAPEPEGAREGQKTDEVSSAKRAVSSLGSAAPRGGASGDLTNRLQLEKSAGVCGTVVDARGRPVARAQVVLGDRGVTATSGDDGRFCFDVAAGDYDLTVLAVGFTPLRQRVALGNASPARLIVQTVDVLPAPVAQAPGAALQFREEIVPSSKAPAMPDSVRPMWREAERLEAAAAGTPTAPRFAAAGAAWGDVVARLAAGPADLDAREHRADMLYRAWEIDPTGARATAAVSALRAFIERAPAGASRDRARQRLARLQP